MKKILSSLLIMLLPTFVHAEREYQFDIIFEPDHFINTYSFNGENIIAEEYQKGFNKVTVFNQKMEQINSFHKPSEVPSQQDNNTEALEILQNQMKEKYGYGYMSRFRNGFSFVRDQEVRGLPLWYNNSGYLFKDYFSVEGEKKPKKSPRKRSKTRRQIWNHKYKRRSFV